MNKLKSKFNELKGKVDKKLGINLLGILAVFAIMIGVTYAGLRFTGITDQNSINSGRISMSYKESSNTISIDNAYPTTDDDGKISDNFFDFSITSNATTNANDNVGIEVAYDLILSPKAIDSGKEVLDPSQIKVYLTKIEGSDEVVVIEPTLLSDLIKTDDFYNLYSTVNLHKLNKDKITTNYRLRSWISFDVNPLEDWDSTKSYQYKFKINVNSAAGHGFDSSINIYPNKQDKSGANAPVLASNMIPVYYDEGSNNWKIANIKTSSGNSWYDYDQKKWANAATLYEKSYEDVVTESSKVVNIPSTEYTEYYESIPSYDDYYSTTTTSTSFTFTTGDNAGKISFYIDGDSMSGSATVKLNDTVINAKEDIYNGWQNQHYFYEAEVAANTKYILNISFSYLVMDGFNASLGNFKLPDGLKVAFKQTGSWSTIVKHNPFNFNEYDYDEQTGNYLLKWNNKYTDAISTSSVGKFICSDLSSAFNCKEVYKILEVDGSTITKVEVHSAKELSPRTTLKNAPAGTVVPIEAMNTMWVWIPRYKYTYFASNTPTEIPITFENGTASTGTIKCTDAIKASSGKSQVCTDTVNGGLTVGTSTYTHPAFTFGDKELTGIWVGKFKYTTDSKNNILILPDKEDNYGQYTGSLFNNFRRMEIAGNKYDFSQGATTLTANGEITDDTNRLDTHMMKNMEWGAVSYFTHSKYGKNGDVFLNNSYGASSLGINSFSGRSGGNVAGSTQIKSTYTDQTSTLLYNAYGYYTYDGYLLKYGTNTKSETQDLSKVASTTGNISGIYDMVGPYSEIVVGNMTTNANAFSNGSSTYWSQTKIPLAKYYDKYSYGTNNKEYTRGKLGDGTIEMQPTTEGVGWYNSSINMPYATVGSSSTSYYPWFVRGTTASASKGGLFSVSSTSGSGSTRSHTVLAVW